MSNYQATYTDVLMQEIEATPEEYSPTLLNMIRIFRESISLKSAEDSFKQGRQEAMSGETMLVDGLWVGIDAERSSKSL